MIISLIRAVILYFFIIFSVRVMGKRQIGEMQPSELVITILISQIVTVPMENNGFPIMNSIIPIFVLISLEIIISVISMKAPIVRSLIGGSPKIIIRNGKIDQNALRQLRLTVEDLYEALRQKDVFDFTEVNYAIIETNGKLSVLLTPEQQPAKAEQLGVTETSDGLPCLVISDGKIIEKNFTDCLLTKDKLKSFLENNHLTISEVFIMIYDKNDKYFFLKKDDIK